VIHLNDRGREEDVLLAMAAAGVLDAVVIDSRSAAERMAEGVPLFAGFRADLTAGGKYARVIGAVLPDEAAVARLKEAVMAADLDFAGGTAGRLIVLPIVEMMGPAEQGA